MESVTVPGWRSPVRPNRLLGGPENGELVIPPTADQADFFPRCAIELSLAGGRRRSARTRCVQSEVRSVHGWGPIRWWEGTPTAITAQVAGGAARSDSRANQLNDMATPPVIELVSTRARRRTADHTVSKCLDRQKRQSPHSPGRSHTNGTLAVTGFERALWRRSRSSAIGQLPVVFINSWRVNHPRANGRPSAAGAARLPPADPRPRLRWLRRLSASFRQSEWHPRQADAGPGSPPPSWREQRGAQPGPAGPPGRAPRSSTGHAVRPIRPDQFPRARAASMVSPVRSSSMAYCQLIR